MDDTDHSISQQTPIALPTSQGAFDYASVLRLVAVECGHRDASLIMALPTIVSAPRRSCRVTAGSASRTTSTKTEHPFLAGGRNGG